MVGPGLFETVCHQFDGWRALAVPYQKAVAARRIHRPSKEHFSLRCPLFVRVLSDFPGAWRLDARSSEVFAGLGMEAFAGCGGSGYTLGMDSVRFGRVLGIGAAFSREDDGVGGGCGDSPESFGGGKRQNRVRMRLRFQLLLRLRRPAAGKEGVPGWFGWESGPYDYGSGAADGPRAEGRQQALWRGGGGAFCEAVGSAVAGADWGFLSVFSRYLLL